VAEPENFVPSGLFPQKVPRLLKGSDTKQNSGGYRRLRLMSNDLNIIHMFYWFLVLLFDFSLLWSCVVQRSL